MALWRTARQRQAAAARVAATLTLRYGRPLLAQPRLARPDAIFPEERYALAPLGGDSHESADPAADALTPRARTSAPPRSDLWQGVPLRLHWW